MMSAPHSGSKIEFAVAGGFLFAFQAMDSLRVRVAREKIIEVDDLLATGGTMSAVSGLIEKMGGKIVEVAFLIELTFLKGRERLKGRQVFSLIEF